MQFLYLSTGSILTRKTISYNNMYPKIRFIICLCIASFFITGTQSTNDRIVGGRPAVEGEFPYQVSLRKSFNDKHFCGGTVIGPRHILTAAHCMYYVWGGVLPPVFISVVAGQIELSLSSKSIIRNATVHYIHEDFNNAAKYNDIAIVEVNEPFPFESEIVAAAALRTNRVRPGTQCTVTGWGVQEFGNETVSEKLLAAELSVIKFSRCKELYGKVNITLSTGMMCAAVADGSKDACQGDSGGPLFCNGLLTGVISTAIGCANIDYPGIYTEVSHYSAWIHNIVYTKHAWGIPKLN